MEMVPLSTHRLIKLHERQKQVRPTGLHLVHLARHNTSPQDTRRSLIHLTAMMCQKWPALITEAHSVCVVKAARGLWSAATYHCHARV